MNSIFGLRIEVMADRPRMQLSADCPVTDDFRVEMNEWMTEFFGVDNVLRDGETIRYENSLLMNPRTFATVKAAAIQMKEKQCYFE